MIAEEEVGDDEVARMSMLVIANRQRLHGVVGRRSWITTEE